MPTFSRLLLQLKNSVGAGNLKIAGEAADKAYNSQIQIHSFGWNMGREAAKSGDEAKVKGKAGSGGNSTRGAAQPEEFTFRKDMDRASTAMLNKMRQGVALSAIVTLDSLEDSSFKLTFTLTNVRIVDYRIDGKDAEKSGEIVEDWTFTYDTITIDYAPSTGVNLTTMQVRAPSAESGKAKLENFMDAFEALNETKRIDASARLKKDYPKLFGG